MLSNDQHREFEDRGVLRISGAIVTAEVARVRGALARDLASRYGVDLDDPQTWRRARPQHFKNLRRSDALAGMANELVRQALDDVFDPGRWFEPQHWGQVLFNFPASEPWRLPHQSWHLDFEALRGLTKLYQIKVFAILDRVEPASGGTAVLEGSHRLVTRLVAATTTPQAGRSGPMRSAMRKLDPWIDALFSDDDSADRRQRFMEDWHDVEGVPLRVSELTGEPGDVVLMHPWLFHTDTPNCGSRPRIMLTQSVYAGHEARTAKAS